MTGTDGGYATYGQDVGILVLDTTFARVHGDIGNARTFSAPVSYKLVKAATVGEIVGDADRARLLLPAFIDAARALEAEGVRAITTTCGFLTVVQEELARAVSVPVVTSSLFLYPLVRAMVGDRPIGILTANRASLSERHLRAAGITPGPDVLLRGLEDQPGFAGAILRQGALAGQPLDMTRVTAEVAGTCATLHREVPDLGALLFECTNLQPYAEAVQARTELPIFGIYHLVTLLQSATRTPRFDGHV